DELVKPAEVPIAQLAPRRLRVLNAVGERDVEQPRVEPAREFVRQLERVVGAVPVVDSGLWSLDEIRRAREPIHGKLIRLLGRDAGDSSSREKPAQLVLGRDGKALDSGGSECGMDRRSTQKSGIVELHLVAIRVEVVVSRDAMDRRRRTGDDREVVRVREARKLGAAEGEGTGLDELREARNEPPFEGVIEVRRIAAVQADDGGALR